MVSKIIQHKVILYPVFFFILNCNTSYNAISVQLKLQLPTGTELGKIPTPPLGPISEIFEIENISTPADPLG